jgi:hypothetical protein
VNFIHKKRAKYSQKKYYRMKKQFSFVAKLIKNNNYYENLKKSCKNRDVKRRRINDD